MSHHFLCAPAGRAAPCSIAQPTLLGRHTLLMGPLQKPRCILCVNYVMNPFFLFSMSSSFDPFLCTFPQSLLTVPPSPSTVDTLQRSVELTHRWLKGGWRGGADWRGIQSGGRCAGGAVTVLAPRTLDPCRKGGQVSATCLAPSLQVF